MRVSAKRIRECRKRLHLTQEDVAKDLGIGKQAVYKYENGTVSNIPLENIEKMSSMFHVSPEYLAGWSNSPERTDASYRIFGDNLTTDEHQLVLVFRSLSSRGQKLLLDRCEELKLLHGKDSEDQMDESIQVDAPA